MEKDIQDKLVSYIRDAHAMEKNVEQMLGSMIATTNDDKMRERLEAHKDETAQQARASIAAPGSAGRVDLCGQGRGRHRGSPG